MLSSPHIEAEIRYLMTSEGGRETPVHDGYRGQFHYENENAVWDATQKFIDKAIVESGELVTCQLTFMSPWEHKEKLWEGLSFNIQEGARIVGKGRVIKVFPALASDAEKNEKTAL